MGHINVERAVDMLARIEIGRIDGSWDQVRWARIEGPGGVEYETYTDPETGRPQVEDCRTSFCAAGWVVTLAGEHLTWRQISPYGPTFEADETVDGMAISDRACDLLGIPWRDYIEGIEPDGEIIPTALALEDPRWLEDEGVPRLFGPSNSIDVMYEFTAEWDDDLTVEELHRLVRERVAQMMLEGTR